MEASSAGKREYGGKGRWFKYWARLGCRISSCYGLFPLGGRFETYKPFISLIFQLFRAAVNREYWINGSGGARLLRKRILMLFVPFMTLDSTRLTTYSCAKDWTQLTHCILHTCFGNSGFPSSGNSYVDINCASELVQHIKPKCTPVSIQHLFRGTAHVKIRIPWWWHPRIVETCRKERVHWMCWIFSALVRPVEFEWYLFHM
jgi:hypothetical protein